MSNPTTEQLQKLTDIINSRRAEWDRGFMELSLGEVRLIYGAVEEWEDSQDEAAVEEYANARQQAYELGYKAGAACYKPATTVSGATTPNPNGSTVTQHNSFDDEPSPADLWYGKEMADIQRQVDNGYPGHLAESDERDIEREYQERKAEEEHAASLGAAAAINDRMGPYGEPIGADDHWDQDDHKNGIEAAGLAGSFDEPKPVKVKPMNKTKPRTLAEVDGAQERELSEIIAAIQKMAVGGHMPSVAYYNQHKPAQLPVWQKIIAKHDIISWGDLADMCDLTRQSQRLSRPEERLERNRPGPKSTGQPTLEEFVAELKRQGMAGVMPTQSVFDLAKPATWGRASSQCTRLGISWEALAEMAELKQNPRGPQKAD